MKKTKKNLFSQVNIGKQYGVLVQIVQQLGIVWSVLILLFSAMGAYNTGLADWLYEQGIPLNFAGFMGIIFGLLLVASFLMWKFFLASFYSVFNAQVYKHDNPIRRDIREVRKLLVGDLHNLEKRIEKLEKRK